MHACIKASLHDHVYGYVNRDIFKTSLSTFYMYQTRIHDVIVSDRTLWGWGSSLSFTILSSSGERGIVERTKSDRTAQCGPGWVINLEFQILIKNETDTIYGMEFLIEFS